MRNLLNPKWLFFINTLPIVLLFILGSGQFSIIKSLLVEENIALWIYFGSMLFGLGLLNFVYALYLTKNAKEVSVFYSILALICYIVFIFSVGSYSDEIIPFSIPRWLVTENIILYVGTFLMPTLAYSLFVFVAHFTSDPEDHQAFPNFLGAFLIPVFWFVFLQLIVPLWKPVGSNFSSHLLVVSICIGTLAFVFFLVRGIYIIATKKTAIWQENQLAWKIPITIVLPLFGLIANTGYFFNGYITHNEGIFGDFGSYWFYVLAVLNGVFICLPNPTNQQHRLLLFIGRIITFAYTFYFFLVFLPFLPLSIIAIALIGLGFLMLAPLLLFVIHITTLSSDFGYLKTYYSTKKLWLWSIISFLVIPCFITISYLNDKVVLNQTLSYLYSPDYSKKYDISRPSLTKTLSVVRHHKKHNFNSLSLSQIPYLSTYFQWLVLDNLTLSDKKIERIESIFFGGGLSKPQPENVTNQTTKITNISVQSTYDKSQNAWLSWVNLDITNSNRGADFSEYATTITLPEGAWISDYYLNIGKRKEMGILAEKKTAMWVFSNIRNENKDPGILYYLTGNKVAFRVFPFAKGETRKTGIQILHKEPLKLLIGSQLVNIKTDNQLVDTKNNLDDNVLFVSANQKKALKLVQRKPYFHFLVNASDTKNNRVIDFTNRIEQAISSNPTLGKNAKISFVNSYVNTVLLSDDWKKIYKNQDFEGGFFLERAIQKTLYDSYQTHSENFPIMVVVTDSLSNAILDKNFTDLKITFPENDLFVELGQNNQFLLHSLTSNPLDTLNISPNNIFNQFVLAYKIDGKNYYLPNNNQPTIVLKNDIFDVQSENIKAKNWQSALMMQGKWNAQVLHPETSDLEWINLVKYSFISKIMTPVTSYLVVENEAQKAMLRKKQEQFLASNKSLDLGEETQRMSEPNLALLTILLGLIFWLKTNKK